VLLEWSRADKESGKISVFVSKNAENITNSPNHCKSSALVIVEGCHHSRQQDLFEYRWRRPYSIAEEDINNSWLAGP
jgi:hypothetical protein